MFLFFFCVCFYLFLLVGVPQETNVRACGVSLTLTIAFYNSESVFVWACFGYLAPSTDIFSLLWSKRELSLHVSD